MEEREREKKKMEYTLEILVNKRNFLSTNWLLKSTLGRLVHDRCMTASCCECHASLCTRKQLIESITNISYIILKPNLSTLVKNVSIFNV